MKKKQNSTKQTILILFERFGDGSGDSRKGENVQTRTRGF